MAVRVKVRVVNERNGASKELVVLVNGGAESEEPVIAVTPRDAEGLGFGAEDFELIEVELESGRVYSLISKEKVRVELLDEEGRTLSSTYAFLVVDEDLTEPLITDAAIDELGIVVISFKKGLWRHVNDPQQLSGVAPQDKVRVEACSKLRIAGLVGFSNPLSKLVGETREASSRAQNNYFKFVKRLTVKQHRAASQHICLGLHGPHGSILFDCADV